MNTFIINGQVLKAGDVWQIMSDKRIKVRVSASSIKKIQKARDFIESKVKNGEIIYGVTTGFGEFKKKSINPTQTQALQENLIRSHAIGVGEPLSEEIVRGAMFLRASMFAKGNSGVRVDVVQILIDFLNKGVYPYVPSKGSVGSSGDLSPLSHLALTLMGEGEVFWQGKRTPTKPILKKLSITPLQLSSKEGLALNNGTSVMTSIAVFNVVKAEKLLQLSDLAGAQTLEAVMGTLTAKKPEIHLLRPHPGQINTAKNIRTLCKGSAIIKSHKFCDRVQDSYSIRCMPQVHGASKDAFRYVKNVVEIEINSVNDNPLIFPELGMVCSAGNFHGQPIALAMDFLGIAMSEIANISERRTAKMVDPATSESLPAFLIEKGGLNNGFMIAQYTAASLVSENKVLAHPASVDSIPTSANQEDHVSMGTIAARKCQTILDHCQNVIAIELMTGAQAIDFRLPLKPGQGTAIVHKLIRTKVKHLNTDRVMYKDLEKINQLIDRGTINLMVQEKIKKIEI